MQLPTVNLYELRRIRLVIMYGTSALVDETVLVDGIRIRSGGRLSNLQVINR